MKIKKGDNVIVLTGKNRGNQGKILSVIKKTNKVLIEGVNEVKRRRKPRKSNEKGQTITMASPIDASSVALWCKSCGKGRRFAVQMDGTKKIRVCVKCKETL